MVVAIRTYLLIQVTTRSMTYYSDDTDSYNTTYLAIINIEIANGNASEERQPRVGQHVEVE